MHLRPIGTIFDIEYPPPISSTDSRAVRITYKVINHVWVQRWYGDTEGEKAEEVKEISREYLELKENIC